MKLKTATITWAYCNDPAALLNYLKTYPGLSAYKTIVTYNGEFTIPQNNCFRVISIERRDKEYYGLLNTYRKTG